MAKMSVFLVVILLICLSNLLLVSASCRGDILSCPACPAPCTCVNDEANCSGLTYSVFPEIKNDQWQYVYLDFSKNNFSVILTRALSSEMAVSLDLSGNNITRLSSGSFEGTPNLKTLILADNNLAHLEDNAFTNLKKLITLNLNSNLLDTLNHVAFVPNMKNMTELFLRDNKFTSLEDITVSFPNLQTLDLSGNMIQCDAKMKWISSWLAEESKTVMGVCDGPGELKGSPIGSILPQQFDDPSYVIQGTIEIITVTSKMEKTDKGNNDSNETDKGANAAAIVLPIIFILVLLVVLVVVFWKIYWQPRHSTEKKYSAVNREHNENRVYSETTTDL